MTQEYTNVTAINSGKSNKKPKLSSAQLETDLLHMLTGQPNPKTKYSYYFQDIPKFEPDFRVLKLSRGDEGGLVVHVKNNAAEIVSPETVAGALCEFSNNLGMYFEIYHATMVQCEKVVRRWISLPRDISETPKSWGFKSDPELVFNRLPYDPIDCDDTIENSIETRSPMFCKMLSRMNNPQDFCQVIGSIFYDRASRKQALWNWGPAGAGKSQIADLVRALLGFDAVQSIGNEDFKDSFFKFSLVGKRCLFINEADPKIINTPAFKSLTGDSMHRVRNIYRGSMTIRLDCIVFCSSNYQPSIPNDDSLKSRIISCKSEVIPLEERIDEKLLHSLYKEEVPYIASWCMKQYLKENPTFGAIKHDIEKNLMPIIDLHEIQELDVIDKYFKEAREDEYILLSEFNSCLRLEGIHSNYEVSKIKTILQNRYNIRYSRKSVEGMDQRPWVVYGIKKRLFHNV